MIRRPKLKGFEEKLDTPQTNMVVVTRNPLRGNCGNSKKNDPSYGYTITFGEIKELRDKNARGYIFKTALLHKCYEVKFINNNCKDDGETKSVIKHGILKRLNLIYNMRYSFKDKEANFASRLPRVDSALLGKEEYGYTGFQDFSAIKTGKYSFQPCTEVQEQYGINLSKHKEIYRR